MRFDQYMYPYYKASEDKMSTEDMQELLDCCGLNSTKSTKSATKARPRPLRLPDVPEPDRRGLTRSGEDATNELSFMCLQASANTSCINPRFQSASTTARPTRSI